MEPISESASPEASEASLPALDLNDLLLDHPAASFLFRCGDDILIVDRAALPNNRSLVLVELASGYSVESYSGQRTWGVVTYQVRKTA
jgi:hypothetical protein